MPVQLPQVRPRPSGAPESGAATAPPDVPPVPLVALDSLWFQVSGTVCNLRCTHCFISCAPENHAFWFLDLATVLRHLEESARWGVKEYYFTGGEPFMHRDLVEMLEATLDRGPATVLTNATLFTPRLVARLAAIEQASPYSLEIRVSIDGPSAETNDPIRGPGTFRRAMDGVRWLVEHGFLPIITATQVWDPARDEDVRQEFVQALRAVGYDRPRLKFLPTLRIGREAVRSRGYTGDEIVTAAMLEGYDVTQLLCATGRVVTSKGVHVCPILLDSPDARLGSSLEEASRPFPLAHHACFTCWMHGAICTNYAGITET